MEHEVIRLLGDRFDAMERNNAQRFESFERSSGQRFDSIAQRFDSVDSRLDGLTDQVERTNGKVQDQARHIAGCSPVMEILKKERLGSREPTRAPFTHLGGEGRKITKWDVMLVTGAIVATFAVLERFGHIK